MKKYLIAVFSLCVMALSLAGCGEESRYRENAAAYLERSGYEVSSCQVEDTKENTDFLGTARTVTLSVEAERDGEAYAGEVTLIYGKFTGTDDFMLMTTSGAGALELQD